MDLFIEYFFRFMLYMFFGLSLEMIFSVHNIDIMLGYKVKRRVPFKYLEGFVSLYMIPLHGLGLLFAYEMVYRLIEDWFILFRFIVWAVGFTVMEVLWGFALDRLIGFYPWDYYADSKFRIFRRGYTLWTLVPMWGVAGLILEFYSQLLIYLSPQVVEFAHRFFN